MTAYQIINNLGPAELQLKLTGSPYASTSFTWSYNDAAGQVDPNLGTYTLSWETPLPVRLVSFEATKEALASTINWKTSEEMQSSHFVVERSNDGKAWAQIEVRALGESQIMRNYQFRDDAPLDGENLYRLRMVDQDGSFSFSRIIGLSFEVSMQPTHI